MKPKEKAQELIEKFKATTHPVSRIVVDGKKCALICVEEILSATNLDGWDETTQFWNEVKNEINCL